LSELSPQAIGMMLACLAGRQERVTILKNPPNPLDQVAECLLVGPLPTDPGAMLPVPPPGAQPQQHVAKIRKRSS
jgi:hypothetical protein